MSEKISEAVAGIMDAWPWLTVDAFLLIIELGALVGYKDFDPPMQLAVRGAFVLCLGYFWSSGIHVLIFVRHLNTGKAMPWYASYPWFVLKAVLLSTFAVWCYHRGVL